MNIHQITLRQIDKTQPMKIGNIELLMDGTPIQGVTDITITANCQDIPRVTIEMFANVNIDGQMLVEQEIIRNFVR